MMIKVFGWLLCKLGIHNWEGRYHNPWMQCGGGCYAHVCKRCGKAIGHEDDGN
jgi:hypothetical protein